MWNRNAVPSEVYHNLHGSLKILQNPGKGSESGTEQYIYFGVTLLTSSVDTCVLLNEVEVGCDLSPETRSDKGDKLHPNQHQIH